MHLGLVTIQRNRGPWLIEWFAFHWLVGFRKFHFYAHMCTDETHAVLAALGRRFDISAYVIPDQQDRVQLAAYQHACDNALADVDWMCFFDGDEFVFPVQHDTLPEALAEFDADPSVTAVGVYNRNFGSSGHVKEPPGLVTGNYRWRAAEGFLSERRVKSFVRGRQKVTTTSCSHVFVTPNGTIDEQHRPVPWGYVPELVPSFDKLRMNHYVCQSREYFETFKRSSGHADASAAAQREEDWWQRFDTNEVRDDSMDRFAGPLRTLVSEIRAELGLPALADAVPAPRDEASKT
ncbi:glycosyltransferase family 2 protein [Pelomonas sp. KK5]|uniref:glycosyltransferase family 2 protein n=1 Tax=Pelomonas sp. KK5 TaxID=1855730 RepID=UPI00097C1A93|nr:glycosyltransferase family 2 protein [Pelomonas sp. KK5]